MPVYLISQRPLLDMPSVGEVAQALDAKVLAGSPASLEREVVHFQVAAMELPHFLRRVQDGSLVITPGDRSDLIVGSLMADASRNYPQIAGLLLTGGLNPAPEVLRLVDGLGRANLPILLVEPDTFATALAASRVESHLNPENPRKLAAALALTEELEIDCSSLIGDELADRS
ncbi:MAG: DRTGG domain-containing protein, partial [Gammaproteobacteria bacterium SHHR-1]